MSANDTVDSARFGGGGVGGGGGLEPIRFRESTGVTGWESRGAGRIVGGEEEGDAVWLREAEALLSRGSQDLGV